MKQPERQDPALPFNPAGEPVYLWTPTVIALITFFLGYPGGAVMAAINWLRMGKTKKASGHLVGFLIVTLGIFLAFLLDATTGRGMGLVINFGAAFYLGNQMSSDVADFTNTHPRVERISWLGGILSGLLGLALFGALVYIFSLLLSLIGISVPVFFQGI